MASGLRRLVPGLCAMGACLVSVPTAAAWPLHFSSLTAFPVGPAALDPSPKSVAIGDVTGDGRPDVVLSVFDVGADSGQDMRLVVFAQQADGTLSLTQRALIPAWSNQDEGLAIGDLDGDGSNEVVVPMQPGLEVFRQAGGQLTGPTLLPGSPPDEREAVVRDMNGDGRLDIVLSTDSGPWALTRRADGTYAQAQLSDYGLPEMGVGDVNGDGRPDVVGITAVVDPGASSARGELRTFIQGADGGYVMRTAPYAPGQAGGIAVADLTGDGHDDVAASRPVNLPESAVDVFAQSAGTLAESAATYASYDIPEPLAATDLDGDGLQDLVTVHGGWDKAGVYLQSAGGTLGAESLLDLPLRSGSHHSPDGLAVADANCDGRPDIAIADDNYGLLLITQSSATDVAPGAACSSPASPSPPATGGTATSGEIGTGSGGAGAVATTPATTTARHGCTVPRVRGKTLATARRRLARAGCGRPRVTRRLTRHHHPGRVLEQRPRHGRHLAAGQRARLVVARR